MWGASHKVIKQFDLLTETYGGRNCRDIARVNWSDRDAIKNYYSNPDSTRKDCIKLVGDLAYSLGVILEKEMSRQKK